MLIKFIQKKSGGNQYREELTGPFSVISYAANNLIAYWLLVNDCFSKHLGLWLKEIFSIEHNPNIYGSCSFTAIHATSYMLMKSFIKAIDEIKLSFDGN